MFSVDPHIWLQTVLAWPWMLPLMEAVSALGYAPAYAIAIAVITFGVRLRVGITLMLAIALMTGTTYYIKHTADLPRPSDVDARVLNKGKTGRALVDAGGATTFWSLPSDQAIAAFRTKPGERDHGLISGHVGTATAAVVAILLAWGIRQPLIWLLAALGYPALMALSRMYLGRHFLADVLGGWVIGIVAGVIAWQLIKQLTTSGRSIALLPITALTALWVGVAAAGGPIPDTQAGLMLGVFVLVLAFHYRGWPDTPAAPWRRVLGPLLFIALNLLLAPALTWLAQALSLDHAPWHGVLWYAIGVVVAVAITLWLQTLGRKRQDLPQPAQA